MQKLGITHIWKPPDGHHLDTMCSQKFYTVAEVDASLQMMSQVLKLKNRKIADLQSRLRKNEAGNCLQEKEEEELMLEDDGPLPSSDAQEAELPHQASRSTRPYQQGILVEDSLVTDIAARTNKSQAETSWRMSAAVQIKTLQAPTPETMQAFGKTANELAAELDQAKGTLDRMQKEAAELQYKIALRDQAIVQLQQSKAEVGCPSVGIPDYISLNAQGASCYQMCNSHCMRFNSFCAPNSDRGCHGVSTSRAGTAGGDASAVLDHVRVRRFSWLARLRSAFGG